MNLNFRPARADDASAAVPLIYSAGPEGFEYVFRQGRRPAQDYLQYAFADGRGFFGHRNHTVATLDGRVVGIAAFYSGNEYNRLSQGTLRQILRFYGLVSPPVLRRAMQTARWMPPPRRHMEYVANLGVSPDLRGNGIGAALLRRQMVLARGKGRALFALDVAETNPRAQALYERLGLKIVAENAFAAQRNGIRVPASRRMEMALSPTAENR